jgi:Zn-dependent M28 family amino/carboxypeptidase
VVKRRILLTVLVSVFVLTSCHNRLATTSTPAAFDSNRAYQDAVSQMNFGPRIPGSTAHESALEYIQSQLEAAGWQVEIQNVTYKDQPVQNITAKMSDTDHPVILAAHYDSRLLADQDPDTTLRSQPVPGANDGASGVAVLLEIARVLPAENKNVWLVFFDSEDQGNIPGWDWLYGSEAYADALSVDPEAVVVIDMIGDSGLNIYREKSSTRSLVDEIWASAAALGYSNEFINEEKFTMLDDQTPFLNKGIPAVDIIDFDYPYWHTTSDTIDKISPTSLEVVGKTLLTWLKTMK